MIFIADKGDESEKILHFLISEGENPQAQIVIPGGKEDTCVQAAFCYFKPYDDENMILEVETILEPDGVLKGERASCYAFHGSGFFENMMSHDRLIIHYGVEDEDFESVHVSLDRFHEQVLEER